MGEFDPGGTYLTIEGLKDGLLANACNYRTADWSSHNNDCLWAAFDGDQRYAPTMNQVIGSYTS